MGASLETLTRDRLLRLARERGIAVPRGARKADLVSVLRRAEGGGSSDGPNGPVSTAPAPAHPGEAPASAPSGDGQYDVSRAKFDLAPDAAPPSPHDIPWGYCETRITALPRDPYWLYVAWEVTDESLADARGRLGPGGPSAFCVLRVYETTYRRFDGTNAWSYFDVAVDRAWNHYFLHVGRPSTVFHVDIGLKSHEGYFAVMARSGPAEMPADHVSSDERVEWMTVRAHQSAPRPPYRHRHVPRPGAASAPFPSGGPQAAGGPPAGVGGESDFERVLALLLGGGAARGEWVEQVMGGRVVRWVRWEGARRRTEWRAGPFTFPLSCEGPVEVWFQGQRRVVRAGPGGERLAIGPWHVVIATAGAHGERRVLDTWRVEVFWSTGGGYERVETPVLYRRMLGAYRRRSVVGAGSEMWMREEGGASEALLAGASERLWLGASEHRWGGASELLWLGASELMLGGASAFGFAGASESLRMGGSELLVGGASERLLGGASGHGFGGGSELSFGGSSGYAFPGASESAGFVAGPTPAGGDREGPMSNVQGPRSQVPGPGSRDMGHRTLDLGPGDAARGRRVPARAGRSERLEGPRPTGASGPEAPPPGGARPSVPTPGPEPPGGRQLRAAFKDTRRRRNPKRER